MDTLTKEQLEQAQLEQLREKFAKKYAVILHNDDYNTFQHVITSIVKAVPELSLRDALLITKEAHEQGKAVVIICLQEQAEYYRDRLQTFKLSASIEAQ